MKKIAFNAVLACLTLSPCNATPEKPEPKEITVSKEYEAFVHDYEALFGEKPSKEIWNLGMAFCSKTCGKDCVTGNCKGGCASTK